MGKLKFSLTVASLVALFVAVGAANASAGTYNLTSDHCSGGCGPAGTIFGTVTLTQNGANVDITVHLNAGYGYANTGSVDNQAFKFNATGVVLSDITVDAHVPALQANTGTFNGDGTGAFSFGISCPSCGGGLSSTFSNDILFHVANATIADLTHPNNDGNIFVADVGNLSTMSTGPIDASSCNTNCTTQDLVTPEPTTLLLLGTGLLFATKGLRKIGARR